MKPGYALYLRSKRYQFLYKPQTLDLDIDISFIARQYPVSLAVIWIKPTTTSVIQVYTLARIGGDLYPVAGASATFLNTGTLIAVTVSYDAGADIILRLNAATPSDLAVVHIVYNEIIEVFPPDVS